MIPGSELIQTWLHCVGLFAKRFIFPTPTMDQLSRGVLEYTSCARVYSFSLPGSRSIIARLVAPVKPLLKTEGEVTVMDFVHGKCHNNLLSYGV